jgi:hypothetical protein
VRLGWHFLVILALSGPALAQAPSAAAPPDPTTSVADKGAAKGGSIAIELNKLEPTPNACRGYFVVENRLHDTVKELRLDIFLFDRDGVILRRVGLPFADVRSQRMKIVLFDLAELNCNDIGRLVLNDVLACTSANGAPISGCAGLVATSTRAGPKFD